MVEFFTDIDSFRRKRFGNFLKAVIGDFTANSPFVRIGDLRAERSERPLSALPV